MVIQLVHFSSLGQDEHKIQMSAGQMLLAGFNGLFTKLESEVDTLLAAVQLVDRTFENGVDVYNEIQGLQVWCGVPVYGMVWYGMVWGGMVWCGVVWCGMVWYGVVWYGVVWYGVVWCGVVCMVCVVWHGMVWRGMLKYMFRVYSPSLISFY